MLIQQLSHEDGLSLCLFPFPSLSSLSLSPHLPPSLSLLSFVSLVSHLSLFQVVLRLTFGHLRETRT